MNKASNAAEHEKPIKEYLFNDRFVTITSLWQNTGITLGELWAALLMYELDGTVQSKIEGDTYKYKLV